jgi:hypothetical protein
MPCWTTADLRRSSTFIQKRPCSSTTALKQKRTEFKARQKLADFETEREMSEADKKSAGAKIPTPRGYFTLKRRCNLVMKFEQKNSSNSCYKNLLDRFTESTNNAMSSPTTTTTTTPIRKPREDDSIYESRGL